MDGAVVMIPAIAERIEATLAGIITAHMCFYMPDQEAEIRLKGIVNRESQLLARAS